MRKRYDYYANKRTIPNLKLYTQLLVIYEGSEGINFILSFLHGKYVLKWEEAWILLVWGILEIAFIRVRTTDLRIESRNLFAVVGEGIIHSVLAIILIMTLDFYALIIAYLFELIVILLFVIHYFLTQQDRRSWHKKRGRTWYRREKNKKR